MTTNLTEEENKNQPSTWKIITRKERKNHWQIQVVGGLQIYQILSVSSVSLILNTENSTKIIFKLIIIIIK
jgi:hypothetical protein